jgi:formamidopyrimidine-DNA glycosylase
LPELPEIAVLSDQMRGKVVGKAVVDVEVLQPKNLNGPVDEFVEKVVGRRIVSVKARGKWLFLELSDDLFLLINLGMGGDLLYYNSDDVLPETYKFKMGLSGGSGFTINFWWFGYIHLVDAEELTAYKMTGDLGLSPLDDGFTLPYFRELLRGRRAQVKSFLLNQRRVAGIGNVYVQDILFKARLHPKRTIDTLTEVDVEVLYHSMRDVLTRSVAMGGLAYERDFHGNKGGFSSDQFLVGYKTGQPCPTCSTPIEKIRTGSTASYICPRCQKANEEPQ